jgi:hypothetical protein
VRSAGAAGNWRIFCDFLRAALNSNQPALADPGAIQQFRVAPQSIGQSWYDSSPTEGIKKHGEEGGEGARGKLGSVSDARIGAEFRHYGNGPRCQRSKWVRNHNI